MPTLPRPPSFIKELPNCTRTHDGVDNGHSNFFGFDNAKTRRTSPPCRMWMGVRGGAVRRLDETSPSHRAWKYCPLTPSRQILMPARRTAIKLSRWHLGSVTPGAKRSGREGPLPLPSGMYIATRVLFLRDWIDTRSEKRFLPGLL